GDATGRPRRRWHHSDAGAFLACPDGHWFAGRCRLPLAAAGRAAGGLSACVVFGNNPREGAAATGSSRGSLLWESLEDFRGFCGVSPRRHEDCRTPLFSRGNRSPLSPPQPNLSLCPFSEWSGLVGSARIDHSAFAIRGTAFLVLKTSFTLAVQLADSRLAKGGLAVTARELARTPWNPFHSGAPDVQAALFSPSGRTPGRSRRALCPHGLLL